MINWFIALDPGRRKLLLGSIVVVLMLILTAVAGIRGRSERDAPAVEPADIATMTATTAESKGTSVPTRPVAPTAEGGIPGGLATPAPMTPTSTPTATKPVPTVDTSAWEWWVELRVVDPREYDDSLKYPPVDAFAAPCVCADWVGVVPSQFLQEAGTNWVARFESDQKFEAGAYRFHVVGEGYIWFFVDDALQNQSWPSEGTYDTWFPFEFKAGGVHNLVVEVGPTHQGVARAHLSWEKVPARQTLTPTPTATPSIP